MGLISYSDMQYLLTIASLNSKIDGIDVAMICPDTGTTNAEAMKKFVELFDELGYMLLDYKRLLEQDQKALEKVGIEMKLQDLTLTNLFK